MNYSKTYFKKPNNNNTTTTNPDRVSWCIYILMDRREPEMREFIKGRPLFCLTNLVDVASVNMALARAFCGIFSWQEVDE